MSKYNNRLIIETRQKYLRYNTFVKFTQFMKYVTIGEEDDCWEWKGGADRYGQFKWSEKHVHDAHVASYIFFKGSIPKRKGKKKLWVCHSCDNTLCVNPNHLWLGTAKEDMQDKVKKHRMKDQTGEDNPSAKLTLEKVESIRDMYKTGKYTQAKLGRIFKVGQGNIYYIVHGKTWVN